MKSLAPYMLALCIVPSACKDEHWVERTKAPKELNEPLIRVASGRVVSGFKHGRLREEFDVDGFRISRSPVTVEQFNACVEANACGSPTLDCENLDADDHDVALCVGYENAKAYCSWGGGRLPRLNEWLLAARGSAVQRFPWGDSAATCEQHPLAPAQELDLVALAELEPEKIDREALARAAQGAPAEPGMTACGAPIEERHRVGKHEDGASPSRLEDVLLSKGELLGGDPQTNFSVCMKQDGGCLVYGLIPGAIDAVQPVREASTAESNAGSESASAARTEHPYSFRCVWSEEGV